MTNKKLKNKRKKNKKKKKSMKKTTGRKTICSSPESILERMLLAQVAKLSLTFSPVSALVSKNSRSEQRDRSSIKHQT